jgi:hypothetical protein
MGVLIVAGTVTLGVVLVQRLNASGSGAAPFDLVLDQPPGGHIAGVAAAGDSLAVLVQRPDGGHVLLVDTKRGRVTGEIRLRP